MRIANGPDAGLRAAGSESATAQRELSQMLAAPHIMLLAQVVQSSSTFPLQLSSLVFPHSSTALANDEREGERLRTAGYRSA